MSPPPADALPQITDPAFYAVATPAAPVGVWLGVRVVRWTPATLFYRLFSLGLLLTGRKLLCDGPR